jgi:hypothetical protein
VISKICEEFNGAYNDINIMLCCIPKIGVICGLNATLWYFSFIIISLVLYQNKYKKKYKYIFQNLIHVL